MDRRRFLAVATAGLSAAAAGCNSLGETRRLSSPEEELDADGREKHLRFHDDGRQVALVTIDQRFERENPTDELELRLYLSHGGNENRNGDPTTVENFRFDLRIPSGANRVPARIYLKVPQSRLADRIALQNVENSWTRIAAADAGPFGEETIILDTIISPVSEPVQKIWVRAAATLSEPGLTGTNYRLDADTEFSPTTRS